MQAGFAAMAFAAVGSFIGAIGASGAIAAATLLDPTYPATHPDDIGIPFELAASGLEDTGKFFQGQAEFLQTLSTYQRRSEEWDFQKGLASQDVAIGNTQISIANDGVKIATQEQNISQLQAQYAQDNANFLSTKFTNAALYTFMSGQLYTVYKFFLNQATATARQAAAQLSFERQADFTKAIGSNYFSPVAAGQSTDPNAVTNMGITGSARLLQDIYNLDSQGVSNNKRKLQVSKTISLAQLDPITFQQFQTTGLFPFATTHDMFDTDFPGQYLRLIQSVNVSVIALVPPVQGIRAILRSLGPSKVMIGGDYSVQEVTIQREPEMIAFTSPLNSTGTFQLQQQSSPELYQPFENSGVAMNWVFEMPLYTNRMNYGSISDVQITINYTAEYSDTLLNQVLKTLGTTFQAQRAFSVKLFYPDAWYSVMNPNANQPITFSFDVAEDNFPVNMSDIVITGITMAFQADPSTSDPDTPVVVQTLSLQPPTGSAIHNRSNNIGTVNNMIYTNFISGISWLPFVGKAPDGTWSVSIENKVGSGLNKIITENRLNDIIFNIQYEAQLPPYYNF
jgi:hypothetical protein